MTPTTDSSTQYDLVKLRQQLIKHFDESELKTICFDIQVDYDILAGQGKADKVRELLSRLKRQERIPDLIVVCKRERPNVSWEKVDVERQVDADSSPVAKGMAKRSYEKRNRKVWGCVGAVMAAIVTGIVALIVAIPTLVTFVRGMKNQPIPMTAPAPVVATHTSPAPPVDCTPSDLLELPPQSIAIIEPIEGGAKSQVAFSTLRYEYMSSLRLASGITIEFKRMKSFELSNPGFTTDFAADIVITFLDCKTHRDRIQSKSDSYLTADTEVGPLKLYILKVKRVNFQW